MLRSLLPVFLAVSLLHAQDADRQSYKSPYSVKFSFPEQELVGDLIQGPRGDWKDQADVPHAQWYDPSKQGRWGYWGPAARHYDPPAGFSSKSADWLRERVIATGLRFVSYSYQHHHVPDWEPPADWPRDAEQKTPVGKGLDCSNFTAFVYNMALGIKPTGAIGDQAALTTMPGPGKGRSIPVKRIELPVDHAEYEKTLMTGDLLYVKSSRGHVSHVVIWVGKIGQAPEGVPLILDSTGTGLKDSHGVSIPDGVYLRPFRPTTWYFRQASHALRIIPDGQGNNEEKLRR